MYTLGRTLVLVLIGISQAIAMDPFEPQMTLPQITFPANKTCGEVNVFYTGLTAYHPLVISRGFDPVQTDIALRNDTANLVKAGFNVYVLFQGPDQPVSNLGDRMKGRVWDVTGVGWGIRNSTMLELVDRFEGMNDLTIENFGQHVNRESANLIEFREEAPLTPTVFNWSPTSLAQSVVRHVPLIEDCTDKPGTLYAYEENCPPELCEKVTVVTSGSLEELLEGIQ
ncbi:hypothetical protein PFICI_13143 [Pestalotiopsis fici W106-1]|uniref:Uncharacterized protein n=1 Tax=Pestalotiopsis fici (strain W106-1 / CGMCC3.15140) TaxID=1229662 RepID=W3WLK8_PESFW|nr:uncharacterized protein PFICI_13143 [Pestalotiopsis fici W106-1]ETS74659.1 hypothetical protein PFICI_13143 [Pestalotiopsis fici W106-1]